MTHTRQMADSEGEFKDAEVCLVVCRKCGKQNVKVRLWESSDGAYVDYHYHCTDCGHTWWVDGIDS